MLNILPIIYSFLAIVIFIPRLSVFFFVTIFLNKKSILNMLWGL